MNECLWVRGAHPAAITPGGVVVTAPGNLEIAQQFWRLLHEGADLSSVLQQLTAAYAADLASLPEFVAAIPDGDTLHVAIRGGYELVVRTREGTQGVTSGGVIMWMEHRFSNVVGWRISAVVSRDLLDTQPELWGVVDAVVPVSVLESGDNYSNNFAQAAQPVSQPEEAEAEPELPPEPGATIGETSLYGMVNEPDVDDASKDDSKVQMDFSALWAEHTIHRDVEGAAIRDVRNDDDPFSGAVAVPVPPVSGDESPADEESGGDAPGDHDGRTVHSSKAASLRAKARELASASSPRESHDVKHQVLALLCTDGHPNPTHAQSCRECGGEMSETSMSIPQPHLGTLVTSDGTSVELFGEIIIGRQPRPFPAPGESQRALVVASPKKEISRSHCEVRVTGWDVRLRDLGSNNGTLLIRPGQGPQRVSESSPVIVRIGDVIDLGEGVTIRMED